MENLPPIRLPIGKIMMSLLILTVGVGGLSVVAIALQWLSPQWLMSPTVADQHILEVTLENLASLNARISLVTWYASSLLLVCAILLAGIAAFTPTAQKITWLALSLLAVVFSADKSTGLHHALIHDVLYRMPFPVAPKKMILLGFLGLICITLVRLTFSVWHSLGFKVQRRLIGSALCFFCSEIGINGLGHPLLFAIAPWNQSGPLLLAVLEQWMEQVGSLLLVWGLLIHLQWILQKPLREKLSQ